MCEGVARYYMDLYFFISLFVAHKNSHDKTYAKKRTYTHTGKVVSDDTNNNDACAVQSSPNI